MSHFSKQKWTEYVNHTVTDKENKELESHLYSCDLCLTLYLDILAEQETLPVLSNSQTFTDSVMNMVAEGKKEPQLKEEKKKMFYQSAGFHYLLAAAMTILLLFTGVFQSITNYVEIVQTPTFQKKQSTVTEGILNKTLGFVDSVQKNKGKK